MEPQQRLRAHRRRHGRRRVRWWQRQRRQRLRHGPLPAAGVCIHQCSPAPRHLPAARNRQRLHWRRCGEQPRPAAAAAAATAAQRPIMPGPSCSWLQTQTGGVCCGRCERRDGSWGISWYRGRLSAAAPPAPACTAAPAGAPCAWHALSTTLYCCLLSHCTAAFLSYCTAAALQGNAIPLTVFLLGQPPPPDGGAALDAAKPALCGTLQRLAARDRGERGGTAGGYWFQHRLAARHRDSGLPEMTRSPRCIVKLLHPEATPPPASSLPPYQTWPPASLSAAASRRWCSS